MGIVLRKLNNEDHLEAGYPDMLSGPEPGLPIASSSAPITVINILAGQLKLKVKASA